MRHNISKLSLSCVAVVLALVAIAASVSNGNLWTSTRDINIQNQTNSVGLTITKAATSSNFMEFYRGSTLKYSVNSNGIVALSSLGQASDAIASADGTVTNTFATVFDHTPKVFLTQKGVLNSPTNIVTSITVSNCVITTGKQNVTNQVLAL